MNLVSDSLLLHALAELRPYFVLIQGIQDVTVHFVVVFDTDILQTDMDDKVMFEPKHSDTEEQVPAVQHNGIFMINEDGYARPCIKVVEASFSQ